MTRHDGDGSGGVGAGLGVAALVAAMVVCCAAPVLIAGGALGVLGAIVRSGWVIGAAAVLVLAGLAYTVHRRRVGRSPDCCPSPHPDTAIDDPDRSAP